MKSRLLSLGLFVASLVPAQAEEGMWMPQQVPSLRPRLEAIGYRGDPTIFADLSAHPMGAIVSLGGCSASFVSSDALIVTNHHCVQGALQFNSRPDRDLMENGYLARTRDEELPSGPGSRVYVTVSVEEVTSEILSGLPEGLGDLERGKLLEQRIKAATTAREKEKGYRCTVSPFFEGLRYFALLQLEIQDVRLVYAPAAGIGNFGGETDNWQWPRHTGDFSFLRAYVSKDGKPAPYSKDNVPFRPRHWLKVSPKGASPGDVVFVAGYPGRTNRLGSYEVVRESVEYSQPRLIRRYAEQIALLEEISAKDKELALRVSTRVRGLNNALTKTRGVLAAMSRGGVLAQKQAAERELQVWIESDPARKARYADVIPGIGAIVAERARTRERDALLAELTSVGALGAADTLCRLATERPKPDAERDPYYQQRNWQRIREGLDRLQRSIDARADRALLTYILTSVAALPADQRIEELDTRIGLRPGQPAAESAPLIASWVERLVAGSRLYSKEQRLALLEADLATLRASDDSMLVVTTALAPLQERLRELAKARAGALSRLTPRYVEALLAKNGDLLAPDANSTLRVTYGTVKGAESRDGMFYKPQTTLRGISQKATGTGEFNAPDAELAAITALRSGAQSPFVAPELGDIPVNFLSTVDTTGGNSGSATLNDKGELVGLLFDGTYDTVASDYFFDTVNTRSIHCDSRYMLWVMSEVDQATHLLAEMGLPKSAQGKSGSGLSDR